jgi:hypothetical protein
MTSFAFILGSVPLVIASGAGAELRQALGTAVFFGMMGVTGFGLLFTPTFYVVCRALGDRPVAPARPGRRSGRTGARSRPNKDKQMKPCFALAAASPRWRLPPAR